MTLSILKLLNDTRRADLIAALTKETSLSTETAGQTIDALLPTAISHLVAANKTAGVEKALSLLSNESADSNWPDFNRSEIANHLTQDLGVSADNAQVAITQVVEATKSEVTGLLAHHSLNDILNAQGQYLEGNTPEWGFSLNGLTDMAGKGISSIGAFGAAAVAGVAGAAALASDKAGDLAADAGNLIHGAADKVGDIASGIGGSVAGVFGSVTDKVGDVAANAADTVGNVADKVGDVASDAVEGVSNLGGAAIATGAAAVGAVGAGASKVLGGVSNTASNLGHAGLNAVENTAGNAGGLFRKLLPWLALLLLAALALFGYKQCQKADTSNSTMAVGEAALTPMAFNMVQGENGAMPTITATVGTEAGKQALLDAITAKYGEAAAQAATITVDPAFADGIPSELAVTAASSLMPASFAMVKAEDGTPTITATVGTEAGKQALLDAIKAKYGDAAVQLANITVDPAYDDNFPANLGADVDVATQVANSIEAASTALSSLTSTSSAQDLANALNLEIINFATGKADIPAQNQEVLKNAANIIKQMNAKLTITGHTDNTGNEAANVSLSQSRAEAVKAFLVANGVSADNLTAAGVGSSSPKVANDTAANRFANRRIEYSAQ